jgi:hypothetical protein
MVNSTTSVANLAWIRPSVNQQIENLQKCPELHSIPPVTEQNPDTPRP